MIGVNYTVATSYASCYASSSKRQSTDLFVFDTLSFQMCLQITYSRGFILYRHVDCICSIFLHSVFSNMSSNDVHAGMHSCTDCNFLVFTHCVFSYVFLSHWGQSMLCHIRCIFLTFLYSVSSNVSSNCLLELMQYHTGCICVCKLLFI